MTHSKARMSHHLQPPRDWFSTLAGLGTVIALSAFLGWMVLGPGGTRLVMRPLQLVWVSIVPASPHRAP